MKGYNNNCPDCGGPINIRNPTGNCDHLHYPMYKRKDASISKCDICHKEKIFSTNIIIQSNVTTIPIYICPDCRKFITVADLYNKAIELALDGYNYTSTLEG